MSDESGDFFGNCFGRALSSLGSGHAGGLGLGVTSKAAYLSVSNLRWQPAAQLQCAGKRELA